MLERARVHVQTQTTPEDLPLPTQAAKFRSLQAFAQALVDLNARFEAVLEAEVTFASFAPHVGVWWLFIASICNGNIHGDVRVGNRAKRPTPRKAAVCAPGDTTKH